MSFYLFTTAEGMSFRHSNDPHSVTLVDECLHPMSATFIAEDDDFDCAVSLTADRFAMGSWSSCPLTLFGLGSGTILRSYPLFQVAPVATFDDAGRNLLLKSGSSVTLLDTATGEALHLRGVRSLDSFIRLHDRDMILIPSQRKGELLRVSLASGAVSTVALPPVATLFDLKSSPVEPLAILIDRRQVVHCLELLTLRLVWSLSLKKELAGAHMGVGQFSGDGSLFGGAVAAFDHNYTLVIDVATGKLVNRHEAIQCGLPHRGTSVRSSETRSNTVFADTLDLSSGVTGEVDLSRSGTNAVPKLSVPP